MWKLFGPIGDEQCNRRMEATVEAPSAQTRKDYTSRPGALSRFFRMSRDGWKSKYKDLKATVKGYKNRIAHLTRSREQWRIRAERAGEQITTLEVEIAVLTTDYRLLTTDY